MLQGQEIVRKPLKLLMPIRPAEHQTDELVQKGIVQLSRSRPLISQTPLLPEVTVKPEAPDRVSRQSSINTSNSLGRGRDIFSRLCKDPNVLSVLFSKISSWGILGKRGAKFVWVRKHHKEQGPLLCWAEWERKGCDRPTLVVVLCFRGVHSLLLFAFWNSLTVPSMLASNTLCCPGWPQTLIIPFQLPKCWDYKNLPHLSLGSRTFEVPGLCWPDMNRIFRFNCWNVS